MTTYELGNSAAPGMGARVRQRMLMWLIVSVLAALLVYFGFRGYLNPEFVFDFANHLYC